MAIPPSVGAHLRFPQPPRVSLTADADVAFELREVIYERRKYSLPFRPPRDFAPTLVEDDWKFVPYGPGYARQRLWTFYLWAVPSAHEEIQREFERLNTAISAAGGEALFAAPLEALHALPSDVRYFFARRRVLWRWLRAESLDELPFVIISSGDVPSWGTL